MLPQPPTPPAAPPAGILNVAAYRFVPLPDVQTLADAWRARAEAHGLRGTLLLAQEGLNLSLAGEPAALRAFIAALRQDPRLADLTVKESFSDTMPFGRLRVKVKREIIRMDCPTIRPAEGRAPAVDPATLARWLREGRCDDGRPVKLLDTRNAFEVDAGAFDGAVDWRLSRFGDFPAALAAHRAELEGATVVSYCTGGIRCEKAALLMQAAGVSHVRQLDGGILQYFQDQPGAPGWHGRCVVFDDRGALDATLAPATA